MSAKHGILLAIVAWVGTVTALHRWFNLRHPQGGDAAGNAGAPLRVGFLPVT